jgi:hypothetical protein
MTDNPCTCDNCPNTGTEKCPYDVQCNNEDGGDYIVKYRRSAEFRKFSALCGLMCHSNARDHLNKEVITELEHIKNMVDDTKDLSDQYRTKGISSCVQSELTDIMGEIDKAIKLLKTGV